MAVEIKKINGVYMGSQEIASTRFASDANAVAYYKFNTGALTTDSIGTYTLTNQNTVADVAGKFGGAADLGASNSNKSLYINNSMGIQNGDQSLSFWANFYSFDGGGDKVFQKGWDGGNPGTDNQWMIDMIEPNSTQFTLRVYGNGATGTWTHGLATGTWHHFVMTYKNSNSNCLLYCDGQQVISLTANNSLTANTTNLFILGAAGDRGLSVPSSAYSSIKFDDVSLFSRVLTSDEIYSLYKTGVKKLNGQVNLNPELESTSLRGDANLVGYWRMESNGTDSSANGYNLTFAGTPSYVAGKFGNAIDLEVSTANQFFSIANASCANLEISGSQTWGAWVNLESLGVNNLLMAKYSGGTHIKQMYINTSNQPVFQITGLSDVAVTGSTVLTSGTWYQIVGRYNGSAIEIFVNGTKVGSDASTGSAGDTDGLFYVGANNGASGFDGLVDDAFVFNRALTDTEISNLYNTNIKKYNQVSNV